MNWSDPGANPLRDIAESAKRARERHQQALRDEFRERTGYTMICTSDGGSDGTVSWLFSTEGSGYVECYYCEVRIPIPMGMRMIPSPWAICPHMLERLPGYSW